MMNSISGAFSLTKRTICLLSVIPPVSTTRPFVTLARFRKSITLTAITSESETTMSSFVASRLFSLCVQSLFIKTEQRVDSGYTTAFLLTLFTSASVMSMRASCCFRNSPVPEAHLLPEKLFIILPCSSSEYTIKSSPPMLTTAAGGGPDSFNALNAASTHSGSRVPATANMKRPSLPVTSAGIPSAAFPSSMSLSTAAAKFPSCGTAALQTASSVSSPLPSAKTIFKLVDPIFIPNVLIVSV